MDGIITVNSHGKLTNFDKKIILQLHLENVPLMPYALHLV